jgi:hypothetical protein
MNNILLAALLAGGLALPGVTTTADAKEGGENHGQHKGQENDHSKRFDRSTHDRRDFGHNQRDIHRDGRWDNHRGQPVRHDVRNDRIHDGRIDNRGHLNKPEIRQDFKAIHKVGAEVKQDRGAMRKDYAELRKDRGELRKDIRSGASKTEILNDRKEIRDDRREISKDRTELRKDQNALNTARQELKNDLRKR